MFRKNTMMSARLCKRASFWIAIAFLELCVFVPDIEYNSGRIMKRKCNEKMLRAVGLIYSL